MNSSPWDCILGITASPPLSRGWHVSCTSLLSPPPGLSVVAKSLCVCILSYFHINTATQPSQRSPLICVDVEWKQHGMNAKCSSKLAYHQTLLIIIIWSLSPWHCDCDHCDQLQGWSALIGVSDPVILTRTGGKPRGPDGDIGLCMTLSHGESRRKVCSGY